MAWGKPKRAKAVARPETAKEAIEVKEGLERMYPEMMAGAGNWSKPRKKGKK